MVHVIILSILWLISIGFGYFMGITGQRTKDKERGFRIISMLEQEGEITQIGVTLAHHAMDGWIDVDG